MKLAQLNNPAAGSLSPSSGTEAVAQFGNVIQLLITILLVVAALVFFFWFLIGGIRWIMSSGDKAKIEGARDAVLHALVGLVVVFSLWAVLQVIGVVFGIDILKIDFEALRIS